MEIKGTQIDLREVKEKCNGCLRRERTARLKMQQTPSGNVSSRPQCTLSAISGGSGANYSVISFRAGGFPRSLAVTCAALFVLVSTCTAFNLDVNSPVVFSYPGQDAGSYFGYTVAMFKRPSSGERWVLVGAPRANSPVFLADVERPGALYRCDTNARCEEILIDAAKNNDRDQAVFGDKTRIFIHGKDNQWLGGSLDVDTSRGIVTCASRWYNKNFLTAGYYFMNGLCYELPLDLMATNIRKIPALVDGEKQTMILPGNLTRLNYGMGSMGAAVHYTADGRDLLLGAPGLYTWTGGFIDIDNSGNTNHISQYENLPTEISEMAGYAMTSGQYFGNGQTYFAIGSPRYELTGKVLLYEGDRKLFQAERPFLSLNGSELGNSQIPVNGFYGSALCSADVNNDGRDDLIVGAPLFSDTAAYETGLVLVYLGQAGFTFKPQKERLTGSGYAGARFGTAIASMGDLNMDGFTDIVVGAPYEGDAMQGSVYIYNGCKLGVWHHFSQRLDARTLAPALRSFGISFSRPMDFDENGINDLLVGAYLSDRAYLFLGKPVINVQLTLASSVSQIEPSLTAAGLRLTTCLQYNYFTVTYIQFNVTIELDTYMGEYNRIMFDKGSRMTSFLLKVFHNEKSCDTRTLTIKSTVDLMTPVRIQASYSVVQFASSGDKQPAINRFHGDDPNRNLMIAVERLEFKKNCPDNRCRTDLTLTAAAEYQQEAGNLILGTSSLVLDVSIRKSGDPSYGSNLFVAFPKSMRYQKVEKVAGETEVQCGFIELREEASDADPDVDSLEYLQRQLVPKMDKEAEEMLVCSFGNPLSNNTGVRFRLHMVVPESVKESKLYFRLNATTLSDELRAEDNTQNIDIPVKYKVATAFKGVSRPSILTLADPALRYNVTHVYELRNQGPSPLPAALLMIEFPQVQQSGRVQIKLNTTEWSCPPPCRITCEFPNMEENKAPAIFSANIGPSYSVKTSPSTSDVNVGEAKSLSSLRNTDCNKHRCSRYDCKLTDIPARESAVVTLTFHVAGDTLDVVTGGQTLTIRSDAFVRLDRLERLITDTTTHVTDVFTDLVPVTPPRKPLAWWIILISVLAGLLLILLVVFILWKCGFFKRKDLEEMRRMQHKGEVKPMLEEEEAAAEADANGT
ncbi:integrin alpha pat-2-like [Dreissena polymorpha]|uniref:Integrin alpha-2 domain-containing protein n=1 Tax=Dreissena polymorpha TaxID=45954 RepID=A0A9D4FEI9_DREPO|nr:integrin alpha pat-2-like [Dreissena polymorpha]KAH3795943.1 hypothetical protein DPMN_149505 [Dreissena polymorpha]